MEIIAHRGVHRSKTEENTISAFAGAVFAHCDMLELDCRLTKDRQLVVNHDPYFTLRDNSQVYISQNTFKDLCGKVGSVIPLEFVLRVFAGAIKINIELKDGGCAFVLVKLLDKFSKENNWSPEFTAKNIIVSSFILEEAATFKNFYYPQVETAWIRKHRQFLLTTKSFLWRKLSVFGFDAIHLNRESIDLGVVSYFKEKGFKVRVYTVNDLDLLKKCLQWGVDGVFTDKAQEFLKAQKELFLLRKYARISRNF